MIGKTNSKQVVESAMEFVNVQLSTNQSSHQDILGAKVIVSYGTYTNEYAWNGDDVTFTVPAQVDYTVSFGEIEGYRKPSSVTFSAVEDNARTIEAVYETEIVSVDLSATDGSSLDGAVVTINGKSQTWKGTTLTQKVAYGTVYSVVAGALDGYVTPSAQTNITANRPSRSLSFSYVASSLTVNILSNQDTDAAIASVKATVSYGSTSEEVSSGQAVNIPSGSEVTVSFPEVEGYKKPEDIIFTYNGGAVVKSGTYQCELLTVNVSADSGSVSGFEVTISKQETVGISTKYTRLEYIESTGTQYIDTGFKPKYNTRVVMDVSGIGTNAPLQIFGAKDEVSATASNQFNLYRNSATTIRDDYFGGNQTISISDASVRTTIDKNANITTLFGQTVNQAKVSSGACSYNMALFAINEVGTIKGYSSYKMYSCKIYDNGTLVRDYIPALRSDGIAGLYDAVNDTFYASKGSGNFTFNSDYQETIATQTSVTGSYKIPFGTSYAIQASKVSKYETPSAVIRVASEKSFTANQEYKAILAVDLSLQDIYGNSIDRTTANCYVVKETGVYRLPLVYGNALKNGSTNSTSYTKNSGSKSHDFVAHDGTVITTPYIETLVGNATSAQLSIADTDGVFANISIVDGSPCRYLQFSVDSIPSTGANGVISIKNSSGVIMWSWHIWVWHHDLTPIEITNATGVKYNVMPVNLATKLDDGTVYGEGTTGYKNWFYQWGRPNPMLCPSAYNSTSNHASYGVLNFAISACASEMHLGIQNPTTCYKYSGFSYNPGWFTGDNYNKVYNLWDASRTTQGLSDNNVVKTIYDPCPIGFCVGNGSFSTGFATGVIGIFENGWKFKRYSGDTIGAFFPASGCRNVSGILANIGSSGHILSSALNKDAESYITHYNYNESNIDSGYQVYRATSGSIRPVQE